MKMSSWCFWAENKRGLEAPVALATHAASVSSSEVAACAWQVERGPKRGSGRSGELARDAWFSSGGGEIKP